jgi:hypothetical protein
MTARTLLAGLARIRRKSVGRRRRTQQGGQNEREPESFSTIGAAMLAEAGRQGTSEMSTLLAIGSDRFFFSIRRLHSQAPFLSARLRVIAGSLEIIARYF